MVVPERGAHGKMVKQELEVRAGHVARSIGICKVLGLLLSTGEGMSRNEGGVNKKKENKVSLQKAISPYICDLCNFLYVHYIFI